MLVFGCCCWDRDWLLYPNFNYPSWSYAFANLASLVSIFATVFMYKVRRRRRPRECMTRYATHPTAFFQDYKDAKERKEKNKALIMQMHPPAFSMGSSQYHMGGSGYI